MENEWIHPGYVIFVLAVYSFLAFEPAKTPSKIDEFKTWARKERGDAQHLATKARARLADQYQLFYWQARVETLEAVLKFPGPLTEAAFRAHMSKANLDYEPDTMDQQAYDDVLDQGLAKIRELTGEESEVLR